MDNYGLHRALLYANVCRETISTNTMKQVSAFLDAAPYECDCGTAPELLQVGRDNTSQSYHGVYRVLLHSGL